MEYKNIILDHFSQSGFRIKISGLIVYIDPYKLTSEQIEPADYIFITHGHFDHCSVEDLQKIISEKTIVVASEECRQTLVGLLVRKIYYLKPGSNLNFGSLSVQAVQAYNIDKFKEPALLFHLPEGDGLGYVLETLGARIYHAGDTDCIPEMAELKNIDIACLPVSGTYVMTAEEAAKAATVIQPKMAIPMHYGAVVGSVQDAEKFRQLLQKEKNINVQII